MEAWLGRPEVSRGEEAFSRWRGFVTLSCPSSSRPARIVFRLGSAAEAAEAVGMPTPGPYGPPSSSTRRAPPSSPIEIWLPTFVPYFFPVSHSQSFLFLFLTPKKIIYLSQAARQAPGGAVGRGAVRMTAGARSMRGYHEGGGEGVWSPTRRRWNGSPQGKKDGRQADETTGRGGGTRQPEDMSRREA